MGESPGGGTGAADPTHARRRRSDGWCACRGRGGHKHGHAQGGNTHAAAALGATARRARRGRARAKTLMRRPYRPRVRRVCERVIELLQWINWWPTVPCCASAASPATSSGKVYVESTLRLIDEAYQGLPPTPAQIDEVRVQLRDQKAALQEERDAYIADIIALQELVFQLEDDKNYLEEEMNGLRAHIDATAAAISNTTSPLLPNYSRQPSGVVGGAPLGTRSRQNSTLTSMCSDGFPRSPSTRLRNASVVSLSRLGSSFRELSLEDRVNCPDCQEPYVSSKWCPATGAKHVSPAEKEVASMRRHLSALARDLLARGFVNAENESTASFNFSVDTMSVVGRDASLPPTHTPPLTPQGVHGSHNFPKPQVDDEEAQIRMLRAVHVGPARPLPPSSSAAAARTPDALPLDPLEGATAAGRRCLLQEMESGIAEDGAPGGDVCEACGELYASSQWCPATGARHASLAEREVTEVRTRLCNFADGILAAGFIAEVDSSSSTPMASPPMSPDTLPHIKRVRSREVVTVPPALRRRRSTNPPSPQHVVAMRQSLTLPGGGGGAVPGEERDRRRRADTSVERYARYIRSPPRTPSAWMSGVRRVQEAAVGFDHPNGSFSSGSSHPILQHPPHPRLLKKKTQVPTLPREGSGSGSNDADTAPRHPLATSFEDPRVGLLDLLERVQQEHNLADSSASAGLAAGAASGSVNDSSGCLLDVSNSLNGSMSLPGLNTTAPMTPAGVYDDSVDGSRVLGVSNFSNIEMVQSVVRGGEGDGSFGSEAAPRRGSADRVDFDGWDSIDDDDNVVHGGDADADAGGAPPTPDTTAQPSTPPQLPRKSTLPLEDASAAAAAPAVAGVKLQRKATLPLADLHDDAYGETAGAAAAAGDATPDTSPTKPTLQRKSTLPITAGEGGVAGESGGDAAGGADGGPQQRLTRAPTLAMDDLPRHSTGGPAAAGCATTRALLCKEGAEEDGSVSGDTNDNPATPRGNAFRRVESTSEWARHSSVGSTDSARRLGSTASNFSTSSFGRGGRKTLSTTSLDYAQHVIPPARQRARQHPVRGSGDAAAAQDAALLAQVMPPTVAGAGASFDPPSPIAAGSRDAATWERDEGAREDGARVTRKSTLPLSGDDDDLLKLREDMVGVEGVDHHHPQHHDNNTTAGADGPRRTSNPMIAIDAPPSATTTTHPGGDAAAAASTPAPNVAVETDGRVQEGPHRHGSAPLLLSADVDGVISLGEECSPTETSYSARTQPLGGTLTQPAHSDRHLLSPLSPGASLGSFPQPGEEATTLPSPADADLDDIARPVTSVEDPPLVAVVPARCVRTDTTTQTRSSGSGEATARRGVGIAGYPSLLLDASHAIPATTRRGGEHGGRGYAGPLGNLMQRAGLNSPHTSSNSATAGGRRGVSVSPPNPMPANPVAAPHPRLLAAGAAACTSRRRSNNTVDVSPATSPLARGPRTPRTPRSPRQLQRLPLSMPAAAAAAVGGEVAAEFTPRPVITTSPLRSKAPGPELKGEEQGAVVDDRS